MSQLIHSSLSYFFQYSMMINLTIDSQVKGPHSDVGFKSNTETIVSRFVPGFQGTVNGHYWINYVN